MSKQKHVWIVVDKDGYTGHDFARNFYTDAFFARSDARYDAATLRGNGRVVKYVPENKALVDAAEEAIDAIEYLIAYLNLAKTDLEKALAKEDK